MSKYNVHLIRQNVVLESVASNGILGTRTVVLGHRRLSALMSEPVPRRACSADPGGSADGARGELPNRRFTNGFRASALM
jgi:hypothetical protein